MPKVPVPPTTPLDHAERGKQNLEAYEAMPDRFPEWKATILFYAALHFLEALAVAESRPNREHAERERFVMERARSLYPAYNRLQTESEKARYMNSGTFAMSADAIRRELEPLVLKIRREVAQRLASQGGKSKKG